MEWFCSCGNYCDRDWPEHRPTCYNEPPWGCDCSDCQDRAIDCDEEEEIAEDPY